MTFCLPSWLCVKGLTLNLAHTQVVYTVKTKAITVPAKEGGIYRTISDDEILVRG